jgi:hypothetical protein
MIKYALNIMIIIIIKYILFLYLLYMIIILSLNYYQSAKILKIINIYFIISKI